MLLPFMDGCPDELWLCLSTTTFALLKEALCAQYGLRATKYDILVDEHHDGCRDDCQQAVDGQVMDLTLEVGCFDWDECCVHVIEFEEW